MSAKNYGPFRINGREGPFCTIFVKAGDGVTVRAPASDRIHLGGFAGGQGEVGPDGRSEPARDAAFPAPALKRHSLIFRIGDGRWRQGGSSAAMVIADVDGVVRVHVNDDLLTDNTGGWNVTVTRTTWVDINDLPRPASSALFQDLEGNMRHIYMENQNPGVLRGGNLWSRKRDRSLNWTSTGEIAGVNHTSVSTLRPENAFLYPSWFLATDGRFWGLCVHGGQVKYFVEGAAPVAVPGANNCVGAPSMIQSRHGNRGNFELAYPASDGTMKFRFADNNSRSCDWRAPLIWIDHEVSHVDSGFRIKAVRLLQSSINDHLEVIAFEDDVAGNVRLKHLWRDDHGTWLWNNGAVLPDSQLVHPSGIPAFIQSSFRTGTGPHGNFEVIAPSRNGGLLHWHFDFGLWDYWRSDPPINPGGRLVKAVHMIQANFGARRNNFEVAAETGNPSSGLGSGELLFYWCNNDRATNSHDGVWNGP